MVDKEKQDAAGVTLEPELKIQSIKIQIDPPDSYVYSNIAGIAITPWDVRINFADVKLQDRSDIATTAVTGIVMPPEHAAGLALLLVDQLRLFEAQNGPIRHPKWAKLRESTKGVIPQQENPTEGND